MATTSSSLWRHPDFLKYWAGESISLIGSLALPAAAQGPFVFAVAMLMLGLFVSSSANPVYNITQVSLRQSIIPLRLQGRMNASMRFLVWGTIPLGSLAGGALGEVIGNSVHTAGWSAGRVACCALGILFACPKLAPGAFYRRRAGHVKLQSHPSSINKVGRADGARNVISSANGEPAYEQTL
ncbi:MAG TPA: hypothetical protein VFQ23_07055 [Anaerolineales bacterium]|nr:hypothetical protein [Anaerolineales bacterium]